MIKKIKSEPATEQTTIIITRLDKGFWLKVSISNLHSELYGIYPWYLTAIYFLLE